VDLNSISSIRKKFIKNFFVADFEENPNVLFEYQKELLDKNLLDAYNHFLFHAGAKDEFIKWLETHKKEYDEFVEWYIKNENIIDININNKFIR